MVDHRRRNTLRYPGFDYGSPGAVFVTICTANRQRLFGEVRQDTMHLNDPGEAVLRCWQRLPDRFPDLALDGVILMPDHLHGIVLLGTDPGSKPKGHLLGDAIRSFKSATRRAWSSGVRDRGWQPYDGELWQRGFYDTILNPERPIDRVREYIIANPARWHARVMDELR